MEIWKPENENTDNFSVFSLMNHKNDNPMDVVFKVDLQGPEDIFPQHFHIRSIGSGNHHIRNGLKNDTRFPDPGGFPVILLQCVHCQ